MRKVSAVEIQLPDKDDIGQLYMSLIAQKKGSMESKCCLALIIIPERIKKSEVGEGLQKGRSRQGLQEGRGERVERDREIGLEREIGERGVERKQKEDGDGGSQ